MSTVYTTDLAPESAAQGKWAAFVARSAAHRASDRVGQNRGGLAVRHRPDLDLRIRMDVEHGSHQQATGQIAERVPVDIAINEEGEVDRSEEQTSELQSLMRDSYA